MWSTYVDVAFWMLVAAAPFAACFGIALVLTGGSDD